MIKETSIQKLEKSAVKLTLTVEANETQKAYQSLLSEYSKQAQIKGFRPGKVPVSVLESKFGDSIKAEATQNVVESSLKEAFETIKEKPLPYAQPRMDENFTFVVGQPFTFSVSYDVYPDVSLGSYKGLSVEEVQVSIGKDDLETELEQIQDQNAIVTEVNDGPIKKGDIVTCSFSEVDGTGAEIPGTKREDFVVTVGKQEGVYAFDDEIIGVKKGGEKTFSKTYPGDYSYQDLAGKTVSLSVKVSRIRRKDLPKLDDELAQDVDSKYKTLDDLKKDITARLEKTAKEKVRQKLVESLMDKIVETSTLELPESMILSQIYNQYERMVRQLGGNENTLMQLLAAQGKTPENLFEDWRPSAEKSLKAQVVIQELLKAEDVKVSDEDMEAEWVSLAEQSKMTPEETKKYYSDNKMEDYVRHELLERKLFDSILKASTVKKGPKVKYVDLMAQKA